MGLFNILKKKKKPTEEKTPETPAPPASPTPAAAVPPKNSKPASPSSAAITTPIHTLPTLPPTASAKPQDHNVAPSSATPKPSSVIPPQTIHSSALPTAKSTSSIGPSGRPPLSASQMIRPAGIKVPAKYVPPSGFRNLPPPPAPPPAVHSSILRSNSNHKTSQSSSGELTTPPPKPRQILSSSAGHSSEPLPPPPSHPTPPSSSSTASVSSAPPISQPETNKPNKPDTPPSPDLGSTPAKQKTEEEQTSLDLNTCKVADLLRIPSLPKRLAESIIQYRETQGAFSALEDLLKVPEMTPIAYTLLTGQEPPQNYKPTKTIRAHLAIPNDQEITSKAIVERIAAWPDVTGCILSDQQGQVIAANLTGTISPDKLAAAAKQFTSLTQEQLSPLHQSQAQEIIIPGPSATFYFIATPKAIITLIYTIPTPPARHMEILREIIAQIETQ